VLELLDRQRVGRLAFLDGDQPMALPVNYAVVRGIVVFRTGVGAKLSSAIGRKVAFEVDVTDTDTECGWSVVVQGVAEEITGATDPLNDALRQGATRPWLSDARDHYVRIIPHVISGRRLGPPR
jgi:nitroimidazol reductase NimA-like FMN-containing flavoprotein (pyridoxamine 5'-phosphate oxidase superfamily)